MAIGLVAGQTAGAQGAFVSSVNVTLPSASTSGNLVVIGAGWYLGSDGSITGSDGTNTYNDATSNYQSTNANVQIRYAYNITGLGTHTVTVSFGTAVYGSAWAAEFENALTTDPLDQTGTASGTGGTGHTVSTGGATAQADEVSVACLSVTSGDSTQNMANTSGFSLIYADQDASARQGDYAAYKVESSTGTKSCAFTYDTATEYASVIATFKGTGAGGGGATIPHLASRIETGHQAHGMHHIEAGTV